MATWQVQQAKTHFSEVIERAQSEGPQTITKHGKPRAVVLSATEYDALRNGKTKPKRSFVEFLLSTGPIFEGVDLERDKSDMGRDVDLE
jgi:prevent-host-death family protein